MQVSALIVGGSGFTVHLQITDLIRPLRQKTRQTNVGRKSVCASVSGRLSLRRRQNHRAGGVEPPGWGSGTIWATLLHSAAWSEYQRMLSC